MVKALLLRRLAEIVIGAATAVALHVALGGWWLNDADRVGTTMLVVGLVAAVVTRTVHDMGYFIAGTAGAMGVILFIVGPGTIFPIVLVIGSSLIGMAAFVGYLVGWSVKFHLKRLRHSE